MSAIFRGAQSALSSVHVLIIVVGDYLLASRNLPGAGGLAQEIADFWSHGERIFPNPGRAGSLEVLVSDPDRPIVAIATPSVSITALEPTHDQVTDALLAWIERLNNDEGSIGVLHWVGHGHENAKHGGVIASLLCHGPDRVKKHLQAGIDWTAWLALINQETVGRQVYCFIDACRTDPFDNKWFPGPPAQFTWRISDHVQVFSSTAYGKPAYWIDKAEPETIRAGCGNGPVGTKAFLAALESFGAKWEAALPMPIVSFEILRASRALVERWTAHQGLMSGLPEGPTSPTEAPLLWTNKPKSLVDVRTGSTPPHLCEAQPDALHGTLMEIETAETVAAPHQFRLAREPHRFRLDGSNWSTSKPLVHPHVPI